MKSYKEVVKERYDGYEKDIHAYENIYSLINPIGFNADKKIRSVFYNAFNLFRNAGMDITKSSILDIGCGKGATTRFFSELTNSPQNIYGLDLSVHRIECAVKMNSIISYRIGDIVHLPAFPVMFDIITAIDVFMHLKEKKEIIQALTNIKEKLNDNGYFIWYDAYSKNHFKTTQNQDHSGFHPKQMVDLAEEAGFEKVTQINLFKKIFWKYHSFYLINKFPVPFVNFLACILPGNPGNMMVIFRKGIKKQ